MIVSALILALSDYSTDQRGDVGSWIRVAGVKALRLVLLHLCQRNDAERGSDTVTQETFEQIISGIARLGVEKLEPVRAAAAFAWTSLRASGAVQIWDWEGFDAFAVPAENDMTDDT